MTVYLSPASGVDLLTSSLGPLYPIEDQNGGDRVTYFIYYSHGTYTGPWELSFDLVVHVSCIFKTPQAGVIINLYKEETVTIQILAI